LLFREEKQREANRKIEKAKRSKDDRKLENDTARMVWHRKKLGTKLALLKEATLAKMKCIA
jgi:hypothetical protein